MSVTHSRWHKAFKQLPAYLFLDPNWDSDLPVQTTLRNSGCCSTQLFSWSVAPPTCWSFDPFRTWAANLLDRPSIDSQLSLALFLSVRMLFVHQPHNAAVLFVASSRHLPSPRVGCSFGPCFFVLIAFFACFHGFFGGNLAPRGIFIFVASDVR